MIGLDVLYWACLFLGASYIVLTMALGGVSHIASQMHLGGDIGDVGDAGTVGDAGDFGHVDAGDFGHADAGGDFGHADAGHGAVGHADGGNAGGSADAGGLAHDGAHRGGHSLNLLAFLNPMLATGFLFGFGGVGVLARAAQLMPLPSLGWAAAGGGSLYYLTFG
ncbi:MAG: hypothetical protein FJX72_16600, partial [Armatimonadetes bacterium]|nr:hypothetical protein [Armatimonadota bacterium]